MTKPSPQFERDLLYEDELDNYKAVTSETIEDQSRWSTNYSRVFVDTSDNTYWAASWSRGSTEQQDFGVEDLEWRQVVPVEKTVTVYEAFVG